MKEVKHVKLIMEVNGEKADEVACSISNEMIDQESSQDLVTESIHLLSKALSDNYIESNSVSVDKEISVTYLDDMAAKFKSGEITKEAYMDVIQEWSNSIQPIFSQDVEELRKEIEEDNEKFSEDCVDKIIELPPSLMEFFDNTFAGIPTEPPQEDEEEFITIPLSFKLMDEFPEYDIRMVDEFKDSVLSNNFLGFKMRDDSAYLDLSSAQSCPLFEAFIYHIDGEVFTSLEVRINYSGRCISPVAVALGK